MKKNVFLSVVSVLALMLFSNEVSAQKDRSIGISAGLGFMHEIDFAKIGVEFNADLNEHLRFSPSIDAYFNSSACVAINADFNYLIRSSEKLRFFPISGLSYITNDLLLTSNRLGVNLGMGGEYDISDNIAMNFKAKYQLFKHANEFVIGVGLLKKF